MLMANGSNSNDMMSPTSSSAAALSGMNNDHNFGGALTNGTSLYQHQGSLDSQDPDRQVSANNDAARKRAHHNALERKRRDHIKDSFHTLRDAIPNIKGEKTSRAQILKAATDYIKLMRNRNTDYQQDIDSLKKQNNDIEVQSKLSYFFLFFVGIFKLICWINLKKNLSQTIRKSEEWVESVHKTTTSRNCDEKNGSWFVLLLDRIRSRRRETSARKRNKKRVDFNRQRVSIVNKHNWQQPAHNNHNDHQRVFGANERIECRSGHQAVEYDHYNDHSISTTVEKVQNNH